MSLRKYAGDRLVYTPAGTDAAEAYSRQKTEQKERTARVVAKDAGVKVIPKVSGRDLKADIELFLERTRSAGSMEAAQTYGVALKDFREAVNITSANQIDEGVMLKFHATLRKKGNGDRTVANKHAAVKAFVIWLKMDPEILGKAPKFEKKLPRVYSNDQVSSLLASSDSEVMTVTLDVLRMAGLREQEAIYLQWPDVDFHRGVIEVRSKPRYKFKIKDSEERDVAIPAALVTVLEGWKSKRPKSTWVVGTKSDRPNFKLLRSLKRLARRAGLNCGTCEGCRSKHQECRDFTLHSFRRSYATELSRRGVPLRTIMDQLGHSDLATVERYLGALKVQETKTLIDQQPWWSLAKQRQAVAEAYQRYARRGTVAGLKEAVVFEAGLDVLIEEPLETASWWALPARLPSPGSQSSASPSRLRQASRTNRHQRPSPRPIRPLRLLRRGQRILYAYRAFR
jgi:integrase